MGSVPDWLGAVPGIIALYKTMGVRRSERAEHFGESLTDESRLSGEAIVAALQRDDFLCELVERGLEAAVRSSAESKRRLLAKVVASALTEDGLATPDEYRVLMQTVSDIEPPHVQLLVLIATPQSEVCQF